MPIYEFYCPGCNTLFNFFSRRVNIGSRPDCPKCRKPGLQRQVSLFAATGRGGECGDENTSFDASRMERAMTMLDEGQEPFPPGEKRGRSGSARQRPPERDGTLYEM